jgi:hypothetical protein
VDPAAWRTLVTTDADALIIGEGVPVSRVLVFLWPTLRKPVFCCEGRRPVLPAGGEGTLVLKSANELTPADQERLLEWRNGNASQSRIIAIAPRQLLTLVEDGTFGRSLYDRLKAVSLLLQ